MKNWMKGPSEWDCPLKENREGIFFPARQNIEALAYGRIITGNDSYKLSGDYCVERLSDIEDFEFDLLSDPVIREVLERISSVGNSCHEDRPVILEAEAPFSILSVLMNPVDLYLCFDEEPALLAGILDRIADASAAFIRACIKVGCRLLSLADPTGTLNLVGENYYKEFCGKSALRMMKQCEPFLNQALIHLCPKMARSMVMTGMMKEEPWRGVAAADHYIQILYAMAGDPAVHFAGSRCIWDAGQLNKSVQQLSLL